MQNSHDIAWRVAGQVAEGRLPPGSRLPAVRAAAITHQCAPGTVARAYAELRVAGVVTGPQRVRGTVAADGPARARAMRAGASALRLAGSDDPALDLLIRSAGDRVALVAGPRGSVTGLGLLARGAADAAAVHLLHAGTGRYNDPFVRRVMGSQPMLLLHLWRREQGIAAPRGNPRGIRGIADLDGCRLAWRGAGTGSRLLLERLLRESGVTPAPELGPPADSHLAVAAAVAAGAVDAGLAVRAAADAADVDWIPVAVEPFELALSVDALPAAGPFLDVLASPEVKARLGALPGYDLSETGRLRSAV